MKQWCPYLLLFLLALTSGRAQQTEELREMREQFIAEFDRIGMNTAPEDAVKSDYLKYFRMMEPERNGSTV